MSRDSALLLLLALTACADAPTLRYGPGELDHSRLEPAKVAGRVLSEGDFLGRPTRLGAFGTHLLVVDGAGDSVLHVVSASDGRHTRSFGRRGEGPGEFKAAWSITGDPGNAGRAWVYDIALGRLTRVSPEPAREEPVTVLLTGAALAMQPVWTSDSVLASPGLSPNGRLSFFARDGSFRRAAGPLPSSDRPVPPAVLQHAWVGTLVSTPARGLMALVTQHADQVEIYRADGSLVRTVRGPFGFEPQFTVETVQGQQVMGSGESMRFGYMAAVATPDHVFALFSGRTREAHGPGSSFARYVHVYSWEGELERVIELDTAILSLAVSPDHRTLYGIRHDPEPAIMAFDLED